MWAGRRGLVDAPCPSGVIRPPPIGPTVQDGALCNGPCARRDRSSPPPGWIDRQDADRLSKSDQRPSRHSRTRRARFLAGVKPNAPAMPACQDEHGQGIGSKHRSARSAMPPAACRADEVEASLKSNLMESAGCQSTSGGCRYTAPFGLESGRSNARYLCQCRRWRRSNCGFGGLFAVGAKGTQMTHPVGAMPRWRGEREAFACGRILFVHYRRPGCEKQPSLFSACC
jgi:hypothetical protein